MVKIIINREGKELIKEGDAKEVAEWLESTATRQELKDIRKEIAKGNVKISGEDAEDMMKTLEDKFGVNELQKAEERLQETEKRIKVLEDKYEEVEVSNDTYKKAEFWGKKHGLSPDEYIQKAVEKQLEKYEGLDFTTVEDLYKLHDIPDIDRLKNYQLMMDIFNNIYKSSKEEIEIGKFKYISEEYARSSVLAYETFIKPIINKIKVFEIEDEIIPILMLNDIEEGNLPFPTIAIDCKVWIENKLYLGFLIGSYFDENNMHYKGINMIYAKKDEEGKFNTEKDFLILEKDKSKIILEKQKQNKTYIQIRKFIYSFLHFINSPEIEIREIPFNPKNNQRRQARNRMPLPPSRKIYIHGEQLKKFITDVNEGIKRFGYSHKFWVRGHYEHFRNQKRFNKLYLLSEDNLKNKGYIVTKDGIIKKFRQPFIKGNGVLIEKTYNVNK
jgi:hypothetical protein